ncbi:hypothetical protein JK201_08005 [Gluconobacter kondonii]|nr:hypothetical protein [Gluconobacter kondonii]
MPRIYIDLRNTIDFSRSKFIWSARNAFRDDPRNPGRAYWNYKNGYPIGIYFEVRGSHQAYGWIVKPLCRALFENNLSHKRIDLRELGSGHYQMELWGMILAEAEAYEAKPTPEGRSINRRPKLLPLLCYYLRDLCDH